MTDRPSDPTRILHPTELAGHFNPAASDACEVEIKFLAPPLPDETIDKTVFPKIKSFFETLGWIRLQSENYPLMTRQLDTPDRRLLGRGVTVRIRGNCPEGDLADIGKSDICVKLGKSEDESGAVRRGEYEETIGDFERISLSPLFKKYPKDKYPELHAALDGIKASELQEYFRIDCIRNRYVLDVPEDVSGVPGRRCFGELIMDDVAFVLDIPGLPLPLVFHQDLEVECEILFKPCNFDSDPLAKECYSSPMSRDEANTAMAAIRAKIFEASGSILMPNTISKAERGFAHLNETLEKLDGLVIANRILGRNNSVKPAFLVSAAAANSNEQPKLHYLLSRDFGDYIRNRSMPIARFRF